MLYNFLKVTARFAIRIFCREIIINKKECLEEQGPLLLASNHPNSFLDSVIIDTLFREPVWSLARGDVFKKPLYIKILRELKILPIYRTSEGVERLPENYKTFDRCQAIFRDKGVVMIFSEAKSLNEWKLRPLKKGTARLAFKAWEEGIPLRILPVGINYSSFRRFGKNVFINFGEMIRAGDLPVDQPDGIRYQSFNKLLEAQLQELVFDIGQEDKIAQQQLLLKKPTLFEKIIWAIPAFFGWLLHLPLYIPARAFTQNRTGDSGHYDSVLIALLFVLYPFYLLLVTGMLFYFTGNFYSFLLLLLLPLCAWAYTKLKPQLDH